MTHLMSGKLIIYGRGRVTRVENAVTGEYLDVNWPIEEDEMIVVELGPRLVATHQTRGVQTEWDGGTAKTGWRP